MPSKKNLKLSPRFARRKLPKNPQLETTFLKENFIRLEVETSFLILAPALDRNEIICYIIVIKFFRIALLLWQVAEEKNGRFNKATSRTSFGG